MMNKLIILSLSFVSVLFISTNTTAGFVGPGPGSSSNLITVKTVDKMTDDEKVTLEGYIVKKASDEYYMFKDATGEIEVEIDDDVLKKVDITPGTKVRIVGEVDEDCPSTTIDVDHIEIIE
jgi:uncharacterized protein (TIGR00156 family)